MAYGQDTLQFWRTDSGEPLSECVSVDHGRDENRPLPLISFRNDFPGQRVAAGAPSGCVGPQLRLDRLEVAVLPALVHFLGHCHIRTRPVISYDCHTYPPFHAAGPVDDVVDSGDGCRTRRNTELGKMRRLVGVVAAGTWENRGRFEAGVAVAFDGWRLKPAGRRYRLRLTVAGVCSSWENGEMLRRGRCLRWAAQHRRWRTLCGGVYRQR
jgi:hypothetical protein